MRFGAGTVRGPHLEADARHLLVHRVRALPGRLPGLDHRQGAVAEAADHGPARPGLRGGTAAAPRRRRLRAAPLVPGAVTDNVVWDCVTCGACVRECPVSIEHVDHIVDLRRHLVMMDSSLPDARPSRCCATSSAPSNPWGKPQTERADWAEQLGRARARARRPGARGPLLGRLRGLVRRARPHRGGVHRAKLLQAAGVDFAILGPRESCTGDPARRMGNEYVFQAHAEQNVGTLNEAGVTKIVASCPHCFNTLGNEYPDFGGEYEVVHHTRAARRAGARRAPADERRRARRSPTTTRATWPATTTCAQRPARAGRRGGRADRDGAQRRAHLLLRRRRRAHVDGGARRPDQRGARARGGRDRRRARSPWPAPSAR